MILIPSDYQGILYSSLSSFLVSYPKQLIGFRRQDTAKASSLHQQPLAAHVISDKSYDMKKYADYHGHVLIINNINNSVRSRRDGAERDDENLSQTFKTLGYMCHVFRDQTAEQILELIQNMAALDHTQYNSFVCCLLSHGESGKIYGSDDKPVYIKDIEQDIISIPSLIGKPKIFIIQADRGSRIASAHARVIDDKFYLLPQDNDVFFGYATTPYSKSFRFTDTGSWYIIELTKALQTYHKELDLVSMVQIAHHQVATDPEYVYERYEKGPEGEVVKLIYKQSPQMVSTLTRPVRF